MTGDKRAELVTRDAVLKLLSNEEIARVSTAETAYAVADGTEYLDLENLDQGVQRASAATMGSIGHFLPRNAVSDETWSKILAQLSVGTRLSQTQSIGRVRQYLEGAAERLFHDRGFVIHLATYLAVNALLIVINFMTTPDHYWFYWPLLAWALGIAGHALGVLRRSNGSFAVPRT